MSFTLSWPHWLLKIVLYSSLNLWTFWVCPCLILQFLFFFTNILTPLHSYEFFIAYTFWIRSYFTWHVKYVLSLSLDFVTPLKVFCLFNCWLLLRLRPGLYFTTDMTRSIFLSIYSIQVLHIFFSICTKITFTERKSHPY